MPKRGPETMSRSKTHTPRRTRPASRGGARARPVGAPLAAEAARVLAPEVPRRVHRVAGVAAFGLAAYLCLMGLGASYFWDDESHVGIFARNLLKFGEATGWDERNLVAGPNGTVLDKHLHTNFPPLQDYVVAASFRCFGQTAWAGRLPFALLGIASLGLLAVVLRREFPDHPLLRLYAFALTALSANYLLSARQCRYYMLSAVLALAALYAYRRALESRRMRYFLLFAAAAVLAFYTNYLVGSLPLLALGVTHLALHRRDLDHRAWLRLGAALALAALAVAPYAVARRVWDRPDLPVYDPDWRVRRATLLWWQLRDLNALNITPWPLVLIGVWVLARYRRGPAGAVVRRALEWAVLGGAYVVLLALLSPQSVSVTRWADERYLIPFLPVLVVTPAVGLWFLHKRWRWGRFAAPALLIVAVSTNLLTQAPGTSRPVLRLPALIGEVHRPYLTAQEAVCRFLRENARQDDVVLADPVFMNYPIMFHAGDYVRIGCLLTEATPLGAENVRSRTSLPGQPPPPLFADASFPDWIVCFSLQPDTQNILRYYERPHTENGRSVAYSYAKAATLDVFGAEVNRPEFGIHRFGPERNFDRNIHAVYIYRKTLSAAIPFATTPPTPAGRP